MSTVLVVDDEFDISMLLVRLLTVCGHEAACVPDGRAALDYLHAHPASMVILDVMMPEMDGIEVLRAMRAEAQLRDVPVVMYSAISDDETQHKALEAGAADYLVKGGESLNVLLNLVQHYATPPH